MIRSLGEQKTFSRHLAVCINFFVLSLIIICVRCVLKFYWFNETRSVFCASTKSLFAIRMGPMNPHIIVEINHFTTNATTQIANIEYSHFRLWLYSVNASNVWAFKNHFNFVNRQTNYVFIYVPMFRMLEMDKPKAKESGIMKNEK